MFENLEWRSGATGDLLTATNLTKLYGVAVERIEAILTKFGKRNFIVPVL